MKSILFYLSRFCGMLLTLGAGSLLQPKRPSGRAWPQPKKA